MTLSLAVLSSPVPQTRGAFRLDTGRAVLGRGEDCDWRLDDPGMFVSRHHCVIEAAPQGWTVTDTSSGGLFLDDAAKPLGPGRTVPLRDGMRLRMGDLVLGVELGAPASAGDAPQGSAIGLDPFFAPHEMAPPAPRPAELPAPFERTAHPFVPAAAATPPGFDDPFTLDPLPAAEKPVPAPLSPGGTDWDWGPSAGPAAPTTAAPAAPPPPLSEPLAPTPEPPAPSGAPGNAGAAFLHGAGLDPASAEAPDFEAIGRRYRMMAEGLVALLRARSEEKSALRVAHTTLGAAQVNPLKFLVLPEEQVAALIAPRGPGYLDPDAAITEAFRDLADHRMRSWQGLQAALRRMIDRFSPEAIEAELANAGPLRALLAGGRSALLWQLHAERWAETARAAEDRFLGEIGAEFRDAYETSDRREP